MLENAKVKSSSIAKIDNSVKQKLDSKFLFLKKKLTNLKSRNADASKIKVQTEEDGKTDHKLLRRYKL